MKEIFKFWGYSQDAWRKLTGNQSLFALPSCTHESHKPRVSFGRVHFSPTLHKELGVFYNDVENGIMMPILHWEDLPPHKESLVWLSPLGAASPKSLVDYSPVGSFAFHFDVDATINHISQERYFETKIPIYVKLGISPENLPSSIRHSILYSFNLARLVTKKFKSPTFPDPEKDLSVDIWRYLVHGIIVNHGLGHDVIVPLWPNGKKFSIILNHDVDTEWPFKNKDGIAAFSDIETKRNLRSAWMVVARLHATGKDALHVLKDRGHEIGCHGSVHDHSIAYLPLEDILARFASVRDFLDEFDCVGFRSPSYHRSETLYRALNSHFHYDMSMHDCFTNPNSPITQSEGCSTCFPFYLQGTDVLQIPTTVREDIFLELAGLMPDDALEKQRQNICHIKKRGGVANILTHPEPQLSSRKPWLHVYASLLDSIIDDSTAWYALPSEISNWWKQRTKEINQIWSG
ncbi:MAG: hypothetical protein RIB59_10480 [Rhodospirillales bacterium]